jgi:hypothetical protein
MVLVEFIDIEDISNSTAKSAPDRGDLNALDINNLQRFIDNWTLT